MTKDKDFKRIVRARMAETGERYSAARQKLVDLGRSPQRHRPDFRSAAMQKASSLGHHWAGEEHVLLALLEDPSETPARRALAEAGITYDAVLAALAAHLHRVGPPVPREYSGTLSASSYHLVLGRAEGFALGFGRSSPQAEHALLGLLWQVGGTLGQLLKILTDGRGTILGALADAGVKVAAPPPTNAVVNPLLPSAERQAVRLGHKFIGEDHLVMALLAGDPDDLARQALSECGITYESWAGYFEEKCENGYASASPANDVTEAEPNPAALQLLGRSEGLAVVQGEVNPRSQHGLLGFLWSPRGEATVTLELNSTSPASVLVALRSLGIPVPTVELPMPERWPAYGPKVFFPLDRLDAVLAQLNKELSGVSYAWNRDGERAWVAAPGEIDLQAIVDRALNERSPDLRLLLALATALARELNHTWVGPDHLLLAMLHPDSPGRARDILQSCGLALDDVTHAFVESMGDPFDPHNRELAVPPATDHVLSDAKSWAHELHAAAASSEHVLLALADRWNRNALVHMLGQRGLAADDVRDRTLALIDGASLDDTEAIELAPWPSPRPLPANLQLAASPVGHDPARRRPWGSGVFVDREERPFTKGKALLQYFLDRDGYPVLTNDGRPVHRLVDETGEDVLDAEGKAMIGAVDVPPGCELRRWNRETNRWEN